ncbi:SGNH/GDSL hydrolase family protein [Nocardia xishanensis]|uniref:SGNH/GDSL hydrolase family protein n=1 Tax=Nocardia xishanensis TaxID=238964 RepID=UPI0033F52CB5
MLRIFVNHHFGATMQRRYSCFFAAALPLATASALLVFPAHAAPSYGADSAYVALGDSFSAGLGAAGSIDSCGRSANGYPTLWAQAHNIKSFVNAACGGAVGDDVLESQLSGLNAQTDVVTITIGGNDVGLGNQVSSCLIGGDQACLRLIDEFKAGLPGHMVEIDKVYAAIRAAAPSADVYVLGYPHLYESTPSCSGTLTPSQAQRRALNDGVDALDAALAAHSSSARFHFIDVRSTFAGHGVCSSAAWINPAASFPAPLHPNSDGYRYGYLAALQAVTG